jgi:hypothetical protein
MFVSDPVELRRHVLRDETDRSFKRHRTRTCWSTGRGDVGAASPRVARLPADDEGLDVVPAIALGGVRDALLELSEEVGEETGSACLALAREGTEEAAVRTALRRLSSHGAGVLAMRDSRGSQDKSKGVFRVVVEP